MNEDEGGAGEGGHRRSGRGDRRRRRADGIVGFYPDPDRAEEGERGVRGGNGDLARVRCPQGVIGQGRFSFYFCFIFPFVFSVCFYFFNTL